MRPAIDGPETQKGKRCSPNLRRIGTEGEHQQRLAAPTRNQMPVRQGALGRLPQETLDPVYLVVDQADNYLRGGRVEGACLRSDDPQAGGLAS
jgi:hypothetical protein